MTLLQPPTLPESTSSHSYDKPFTIHRHQYPFNSGSQVTSHAAAALKWGTDHKVEKLNTSKSVVFYDMGATSTVATLVEFSRCALHPCHKALQQHR